MFARSGRSERVAVDNNSLSWRNTGVATDVKDTQLELSGADLREILQEVASRLASFVDSIPELVTPSLEDAEQWVPGLREPLPEQGTPLTSLLDQLFGPVNQMDGLVHKSFNTTGPGYLAYIPGGGILHAAVADLIADTVNRYVGLWLPAPGLVQLEANVIRWFCAVAGYPSGSLGVLTTGGSQANLFSAIMARSERLGEELGSGVAYVSDQVHHSVEKALVLAGIRRSNVRRVPSDDLFRMSLDDLREMISTDRESGRVPFLVVGSGGTTNTGAVDSLDELARIARDEGLWFHVDAAYGGFFTLTDRGRQALRGIEKSDSVTLDPHKGLFLPYGTGLLLVREAAAMRRTFSSDASYLPAIQHDDDRIDFCEISPELSRDFRGLRVWLPIKMAGIDPFRRCLDEKLDLADWAADRLRSIPGIRIVAEPQLSTVAFRLDPPGCTVEETNDLNRILLEEVNRAGRIFISGTMLRERFTLRFCVLSFRTHREHMEEAVKLVSQYSASILAKRPGTR